MNKFFKKVEKKTDLKPRFERISGFDGGKENVDDFSNLKLKDMWLNKEHGRKAIGPEFGCTYSHIKAMKTYLDDSENTDDVAFMCEDDLELFKIEKNFFHSMVKQCVEKTKKIELVSVSCVGSPIIIGPMVNTAKSPVFLDYHSNRGKLYGTGCYMISRKLAKKIVDRYWEDDKLIIDKNHNSMVADHFIYPQGLNTTFMIPSLFTLRKQNDSYIHSEHLEMHDNVQRMMFQMWNNFNVTKSSNVAIVSNNVWGSDYYKKKGQKFNTPTVDTVMSPEDYIKFIENFDEYINVTPEKVESEESYPVGKIEINSESIFIHFTKEDNWEIALQHWEERKKLLPKKSSILFKLCDRKFKGELSSDLLKRFYNSKISKKVVFLSEFCDYKDKFTGKEFGAKVIPKQFCDTENKCCPDGYKLYKICGIN
tara:strand:+ start:656 stop:1924 length:1269 start_codon:yes stop_codon:yes gene_type:complete